MKPRKFLVDITISLPKGPDAKDWSYVDHLFVEVGEFDMNTMMMSSKVVCAIQDWLDKNPNQHDCMDNVVQTEEEYVCDFCGEELTPEIEKLLTLSGERRLNGRATDIVVSG